MRSGSIGKRIALRCLPELGENLSAQSVNALHWLIFAGNVPIQKK